MGSINHTPLAAGLIIGDRYRIIRFISQGGFGMTYFAEDLSTGRYYCIKEYFPGSECGRAADGHTVSPGEGKRDVFEQYRAKFLKEARTLSQLDHPNIIKVYDSLNDNGTSYYVMEYIEGRSLSELIGSDGMDEESALTFFLPVLDAVEYLHGRHLCHLDIKPYNILVDDDARPVLIDFGLAKHYDEGGKQTTRTPAGISIGYAPLEQYKPGGISTFSPETDIYALGATYYTMLTGIVPPEPSLLISSPLTLPPSMSAGARAGIGAAMTVRREERLDSARVLSRAISGDANAVLSYSKSAPSGKQERKDASNDSSQPTRPTDDSKTQAGKPADSGKGARIMKIARWTFLLMPVAILALVLLVAAIIFAAGPSIDDILTPVPTTVTRDDRTPLQRLSDRIGDGKYDKAKFIPMTARLDGDELQLDINLPDNDDVLFKSLSGTEFDRHVGFMLGLYGLDREKQLLAEGNGTLKVTYHLGARTVSKTFTGENLTALSSTLDDNYKLIVKDMESTSLNDNKFPDGSGYMSFSYFDGNNMHMKMTLNNPDYDYIGGSTYDAKAQFGKSSALYDAILAKGIRMVFHIQWRYGRPNGRDVIIRLI